MKNNTLFNTPMELMGFLQTSGMLTPRNQAICMDLITSPENPNLLNDYLNVLAPEIIKRQLTSSPFKIPEQDLSGIINFGITENGMPVGLDFSRQNGHTLVGGASGAGKSKLFQFLALEILRFNKIIQKYSLDVAPMFLCIFSKSFEMRELLKYSKNILIVTFDQIRINPLEPPPGVKDPMEWASRFVVIFTSSLKQMAGSRGLLMEAISQLYEKFSPSGYWPNLFDLLDFLKEMKFSRYSREARLREGIMNRLGYLLSSSTGKIFDTSRGHTKELLTQNTIFEYLYLTSETQLMIVNYLLSYMQYYKLNFEPDYKNTLIFDDATSLFQIGAQSNSENELSILTDIMSEVRKAGISVIVGSQTPSLLGHSIKSNAYALIQLALSNNKDLSSMAQSMGIKDPAQLAYCHNLKPREAVCKFSFLEPFLIKIPEVNI